jgi:acyl-coenzyme A synthetase/AMP-(fatty) acid ligase
VLGQTPSAFVQLLKADCAEPTEPAVRLIVFGGEPFDAQTLLPWLDRHPESDCRIVNMFGITETTVHVTAETITRRHALERSRSVGRPLPGWHVYVMDSGQRMVPPGVAGEICVGGTGVSLGRLDSQVKVRGFRIELDEIRTVLLESPGVTAAAVTVNGADTDDPASARIVLADGLGSAAEVRRHAARILPEYMVPASIISLHVLPLTTNGKLDVAKLPAPDVAADAPTTDTTPAALRDFSQDLLAAWTHTFGRRAGLDDNFFELGGNSLSSSQHFAKWHEWR